MSTYSIYLYNYTGNKTSFFTAFLPSVDSATSTNGNEGTISANASVRFYTGVSPNNNIIQIVGYDTVTLQYNMFNFVSMTTLNSDAYIYLYKTSATGDITAPISISATTNAFTIAPNIGSNVANAVSGVCSTGTVLLGTGSDVDIICVNNTNVLNPPNDNISNNTIIWIIVIVIIIGLVLIAIFIFIHESKKKKKAAAAAATSTNTVTI